MILRLWLSLLIPTLLAPQPAEVAADSLTAVVRGRITNATTGEPLKDVQLRMGLAGHGEITGSTVTDANGNYEIRAAPGLYSLAATKADYVLSQYLNGANVPGLELGANQQAAADFRMVPGATIAGTVTDWNGAPIALANIRGMARVYRRGQIEWQLRTGGQTNDRGEYRLADLPAGSYFLQAGKPGIATANTRPFAMLSYRPGEPGATSRIEDAQPIRMEAGQSKNAINFRLPDADTHRLMGRVTFLGDGKPVVNMDISVAPAYPDYGINTSVHSGADGSFHLEGLIDGHYRMEGRLVGGDERGPGGHFIRFLEIKGADVTNLVVPIGPGTSVRGNLKATQGAAAGTERTLPGKLTVELFVRSPFGGVGNGWALTRPNFGTDGAFEFIDVPPETYNLNVIDNPVNAGPKSEFFVNSVTVAGKNVSERGISVPEGAGSVSVSVAVDFSPGTIIGKTLDAQNRSLPGTNLVVMSVDPEKRLLEPFWRQIKSDGEGAFRVGSLVPGDYLLIGWEGYRPWDGLEPARAGGVRDVGKARCARKGGSGRYREARSEVDESGYAGPLTAGWPNEIRQVSLAVPHQKCMRS